MFFSHARRRSSIATLTATLALLLSTAVFAADEVNTDKTGLAIGGYDPVTYFAADKPAKGDFQITAEHDGAVYRFINEHNRDLFKKNPQRYVPQYGNYCAYGVAVGQKFSADPTVWKIMDGKLYLNLNPQIAELFNKDVKGHIAKADQNWKQIQSKPAK